MSANTMLSLSIYLEPQPCGVSPELRLKVGMTATEVKLLLPYDEALGAVLAKRCVIKGKLPDGNDLFLQANSQGYVLTTYVRLRYSEVMKMAAAPGTYKCTLTILDAQSNVTRDNYMEYDFLTVLPFTVVVYEGA